MVALMPRQHAVRAFHASGRWDRSPASFAANIKRMRGSARTVGTRTEVGGLARAAELHRGDGWKVHHPHTSFGQADCSVEWLTAEWKAIELGWSPLTKIRVRTSKGFLLPPSILVWAVLEHRDTGAKVMFCTTHRNLSNTPLRRLARASEARGARALFAGIRKDHPDWQIVFQYDENSNQRIAVNRARLRATIQRGTGLRNLWAKRRPPTAGTHGRSLLDVTLSTMDGVSFLLDDDESSDHRPYASLLRLPASVA